MAYVCGLFAVKAVLSLTLHTFSIFMATSFTGHRRATANEKYESFRCARTVMDMLQELHRFGYGSLRLSAGLAPSGLYWRASIYVSNDTTNVIRYSSSEGRKYFSWQDTIHDSARTLAEKVVARFPALIESAIGNASAQDALYVDWYADVLQRSQPLGLLVQHCDWDEDFSRGLLVLMHNGNTLYVPHPPRLSTNANKL